MHSRSSAVQGQRRRRRRRRRQTAHRLRLSCADHELSGRRHAHGRTDRERIEGGARSLHRRDDRDSRRNSGNRTRPRRSRRQPAQERAAHRGLAAGRGMEASILPRAGGVPRKSSADGQVLAPGGTRRQCLRGSAPVLLLYSGRRRRVKVLVLGAGVVGTASAWFLRERGHEVTVLERQASAAMETSFANGGQVSVSHVEPWANPQAPLQILKWLTQADAPRLFRPRMDLRQCLWGAQFLFECLPSRTRRNMLRILALSTYSVAVLKELRSATGLKYD